LPDSRIVRRAIVTMASKDTNVVRLQQVEYNAKPITAEVWAPYGMSYNVPIGSMGILIQVDGDSGNNIFLPDRSEDRIKNLKETEVGFFNPISKSRALFLENGDIAITTAGTNGDMITVIKGDNTLTVAGKCKIVVSGDCDITASGDVNISASQINLN